MTPDPVTRNALLVAVIYLAFGVTWILLSDHQLALLVTDADALSRAQSRKGLLFMGLTTVLLFVVARHTLRRQETAHRMERKAQDRFRLLTESAPVGIYHADAEGRVTFVNPRITELTELPAGKICAYGWVDSVYAADRERVLSHWQACVASGAEFRETYRFVRPDGSILWAADNAVPERDDSGRMQGYIGTVTDVTRFVEIEQRLRIDAAALGNTYDGILVVDTGLNIISVNRALVLATGYTEEELLGRTPDLLCSGRHAAAHSAEQHAALRDTGSWRGEVWNRRKNGEVYATWLAISTVRNELHESTHFVYVYTDITTLKESEDRLRTLAHFDPLTSIPNRLLLHSRLEHAIEQAARRGGQLAFLFIDLDDFKQVNDRYGHAAGDELLVNVAARLRARVRSEDTLARLGGDEFVVLLEVLERPEDAARVARALLAALEAPFPLPGGRETRVRASIGISVFPSDGRERDELVHAADAAMYRAKTGGGDRFGFFTGSAPGRPDDGGRAAP